MSHRHHMAGNPGAKHTGSNPTPRPVSRSSSRAASQSPSLERQSSGFTKHTNASRIFLPVIDGNEEEEEEDSDMEDIRPPVHRSADTAKQSHQPLLHNKDDEERGRPGYDTSLDLSGRPPLFTRRSTMRSRSPETQAKLATRKKYTYAAFFLGLSLVSFVIQTETAVYIQHELGWNKAYCML